MKHLRLMGLFFSTVLLLFLTYSCTEDSASPETGFDRSAMLESMANNLIIPNFQALRTSTGSLAELTEAFVENPSEANLEALKTAWIQAVTDYQHCAAFGFGPADLTLGPFATVLGVFPVDEDQVEQNIVDPDFDLDASFDRDIRGFYAVEYLIYDKDKDNSEVVAQFDQDRMNYLQLIVTELDTEITQIADEWSSTYLEQFIASDGTSAGSSTSLLYNEFVKDYENIKNFKVELPAGLTAGQSAADPSLVEAYYSGISLDLIEAGFENSKNIWFGRSRTGQEVQP
jgi:hypothetical protein